jgi:hypothetical protein
MRHIAITSVGLLAVSLVGCGPMGSGPMPPRLEADAQQSINNAWENAINPPERVERQPLLDALILTQAYQAGVDRLLFHSEKDFSGGTVVMEIHFDRLRPNDDRFEVRILDKTGMTLRELTYNRAEIEKAYRELRDPKYANQRGPNDPPLAPEEEMKRAEVQQRMAAVEAIFPKQEEAK